MDNTWYHMRDCKEKLCSNKLEIFWACSSVAEQGIRIAQTAVRFRLGPPYKKNTSTEVFFASHRGTRGEFIG